MSKQVTCCFTGQKPQRFAFGFDEESEDCILLKLKLLAQIQEMRKKGVTTFLSGMAMGVDIWAAELVLELKRELPQEDIRLIGVIPHEGQANKWSSDYRNRYFNTLAQAEKAVLISSEYTEGCLFDRNRYMVDHSAHMIAVHNGEPGGTQHILNYAIRKGLDISIINPDDMVTQNLPRFRNLKLLK